MMALAGGPFVEFEHLAKCIWNEQYLIAEMAK
jgi:hypothetical protein